MLVKPDCIEVWDITAAGLVFREQLKVWGTIVGLAAASFPVGTASAMLRHAD